VNLDHTDDVKLDDDDDDDDEVSNITQLFDSVLDLGYYQLTQSVHFLSKTYEGWNFNSGNYLFTTDTK